MASISYPPDLVAQVGAVRTTADLARELRQLRRREARARRGPELTYRDIADRTGWSVPAIGGYFLGTKLASAERLDALLLLLGATPAEQGAFATARDRLMDARSAAGDRAGADAAAGRPAVAPRMLPARIPGFTGRLRQLAVLDGMLAKATDSSTVVISAMAGMGGVGKTALAVNWAHSVAESFPDGQLYVNLRGYDPEEPLSTQAALDVLLSGLGVDPAVMPSDLGERLALYHRLLIGRRMLVLLDNASNAQQVAPLLPVALCMTLVTSRDDLADLLVVDGSQRLRVDVLPEADAASLLRLLIGERAHQEPEAVRALADLCGRLPLALRVAAEHVVWRPVYALTELVDELRTDRVLGGLDAFGCGDPRTDLGAVFSWSMRHVVEPAARAFLLLGLVPGNDIDVYGLGALAGVDLPAARSLADALVRAHLLQAEGTGRLFLHDLLRTYVSEECAAKIDAVSQRAAIARFLDYYLAATTAAVDVQFPYAANQVRRRHRFPTRHVGTIGEFETVQSAVTWFAAERNNLVRLCDYAARHGFPAHAVALAATLRPFLDNGHHLDALTVHTCALQAAQRLGSRCDRSDLAYIYMCLAVTHWRLGELAAATEHAQRALDGYDAVDDIEGIAMSLIILGAVLDSQGRYQDAVDCYQRALGLSRAAGNRVHQASQLHNLGWIHLHMENHEAAADLCRQALSIYEEIGQPPGMAQSRHGIAAAYAELGRHDEALALAEEALLVMLEYDEAVSRAEVMATIGRIYHLQGRSTDAVEQLDEALVLARETQNPAVTAHVLNALGEAHHGAGDQSHAIACHEQAHELAGRAASPPEVARSLLGLGDALATAGDTARARQCWLAANETYTRLGLPAVGRLQARLSAGR